MNETMSILILKVFDVICMIFGIYLLISAVKMKKTNEIGSIILTEEEKKQCHKKEALAQFMYGREVILGWVFLVFGTVRILDLLVLKIGGILDVALMVILIVTALWFLRELQTAREKFL